VPVISDRGVDVFHAQRRELGRDGFGRGKAEHVLVQHLSDTHTSALDSDVCGGNEREIIFESHGPPPSVLWGKLNPGDCPTEPRGNKEFFSHLAAKILCGTRQARKTRRRTESHSVLPGRNSFRRRSLRRIRERDS